MFQLKFQLIILLLTLSLVFAKIYECDVTNNGIDCDLSELELTKTDFKVEPRASYPSNIERFFFLGTSVVPVLTTGICEAFPNLKYIEVHSDQVEEIEDNAFERCAKATTINLGENKFTKIGEKAFKGLVSLEQLYISGGNISEINFDMTDMKKLKILQLKNMTITQIDPKMFKNQENLETLYLHSNFLFDLDIEEILKYTPKLKEIEFGDNNFKCSRVSEILSVIKEKNITVITKVSQPRARAYTPNTIKEIPCLSDYQWAQEVIFTFKDVDKILEKLQENNSASIQNLTTINQNLQKAHKGDFSTLESNLNSTKQKNTDTHEKIEEKLQENFNLLETNLKENAQLTEQKLKNLTETIESMRMELTQKEQSFIKKDNAHANHQIALWTFIFIIFVANMVFIAYFIKIRRANCGSGGTVYFTNEMDIVLKV